MFISYDTKMKTVNFLVYKAEAYEAMKSGGANFRVSQSDLQPLQGKGDASNRIM